MPSSPAGSFSSSSEFILQLGDLLRSQILDEAVNDGRSLLREPRFRNRRRSLNAGRVIVMFDQLRDARSHRSP